MKTVTSAQVHINILGAVTCFSLFLFAFCTSQTERWSTLIVCIRKLKQQKGDMNFLSSRPLWDISTDTEQVPVHAPNIVIPITQCGHVLFSILCWWCILYYNGTTQNWWNRWLVRAPELTWWKGLHVHLLNSPSGLVTETFVGMSKLFSVSDSHRVRMVRRDVERWWRTVWRDFLSPRCVLRCFSAKPNRHKMLAKEELEPDYQLKDS